MTLGNLLLVSAAVFAIGLFGVLARRHAIGVLLSIELMFNAVNLAIVAIAWSRGLLAGVVCLMAAKGHTPVSPLAKVREQMDADISMLREAAAGTGSA